MQSRKFLEEFNILFYNYIMIIIIIIRNSLTCWYFYSQFRWFQHWHPCPHNNNNLIITGEVFNRFWSHFQGILVVVQGRLWWWPEFRFEFEGFVSTEGDRAVFPQHLTLTHKCWKSLAGGLCSKTFQLLIFWHFLFNWTFP